MVAPGGPESAFDDCGCPWSACKSCWSGLLGWLVCSCWDCTIGVGCGAEMEPTEDAGIEGAGGICGLFWGPGVTLANGLPPVPTAELEYPLPVMPLNGLDPPAALYACVTA